MFHHASYVVCVSDSSLLVWLKITLDYLISHEMVSTYEKWQASKKGIFKYCF